MCLVMETGSIEEIAGLRRDRGVTVLSTRPARDEAEVQLIISGKISCMSRCHRNIDTVASKAQLRKNLPQSDDASSSRVQLCYPRGLDIGSSLIHSIRSRLSSPSSGLQSPAPPTSRRWFYLVTMLMLLIALPYDVSASESNYAKVPLSRTDVTKSRDGFRIFRGLGPATYMADRSSHSGGDPVVLPRSARLLRTTIPPLDFQKMTFLEKWGGVLLVSGRNYIYMINASQPSTSGEIRYIERLQWASHPDTRSSCIDVGKQDYECNNFIRVVERLDNNTLYVCGTNSYEPKCRIYTRAQFAATTSSNTPFSREEMCHSQCGCPYDPATTSAVLYTNKTSSGSKMFSAAVTDFMGKRSYLVRSGSPSLKSVDKWLNDPSFVKLIEYGEKIYLFFRESPTNVETGSDHLTTWSRVAQVCKDDIGGATVLRYQWTSFLKARLTCSTQGSANRREVFHFNNLTSVSDITQITGADGRLMDVVFATFTTPWEWSDISMSAICMYSIKHDIAWLFDEGHFMEEQQLRSSSDQYMTSPRQSGRSMPPPINTVIKKVPLPNVDEPATRPGSCNRGPVSNEAQYFAKAHQTMYESVEPRYGMPVFVTESNVRLTQLALDENAGSTDRLMLYAGTEDGKLLRIRPRLYSNQGPKSVLIEEMNVADQASCSSSASCAVRALHITHPDVPADISPELDANPQPSAFLAFTDRMAQVPLASCVHYPNPGCCNFDPECGWMAGKCVSRNSHNPYPLPEITDAIPANCEKKPVVEPCNIDTMEPDLIAAICNCNDSAELESPPPRGCRNHGRNTNHRNTRNDQPIRCRHSQVNHRAASTGPKSAGHRELNQFFADRVLPNVGDSFRETLNSLHEEQKVALLRQLQEALTMTTKLVLRNHRQEYCLPSKSVNSITHTYPLLLREIELWHSIAYKKMTMDGVPKRCWSRRRNKDCNARISFSVPLAPTLWEPLTVLMTNFSAQCETVTPAATPQTRTTDCDTVPGVDSCKTSHGSNSRRCQPKQCRFQRFAIDVKAFFRHANDSRNFLTNGFEPLWKPVNITLSNFEAARGHLEVDVSETHDFHIQYSPVAEKVKIMFHYNPVYHCSTNNPECTGNPHSCNAGVERTLGRWFSSMLGQLKPVSKKCNSQIQRANGVRHRRSGQYRLRRSYNNQVIATTPPKCRYIKKKIPTVSLKMWSLIVARAQQRGGDYDDIDSKRIIFSDVEDIKRFFDNDCSFQERTEEHETLGVQRRRARSDVRVKVSASRDMHFTIERREGKRAKMKLKFFSTIVSS